MPEKVKYFDAEGKETQDPGKAVRMIVHIVDAQGKLLEEKVLIKSQDQSLGGD